MSNIIDCDCSDTTVCDCSCHGSEGSIVHCVPCCEKSPCGLNIKNGQLEMHIKNCPVCREEKKIKRSSGNFRSDWFACHCLCHTQPEGITHSMPCCEKAPCGMSIERGWMKSHVAHCQTCQMAKS